MTISLGSALFLDHVSRPSATGGVAYEMPTGQIFYYWRDPANGGAKFAIYDVDGTVDVAPTAVDDGTIPQGTDPLLPFGHSIFAVSVLPDCTFTVHYTVDEAGATDAAKFASLNLSSPGVGAVDLVIGGQTIMIQSQGLSVADLSGNDLSLPDPTPGKPGTVCAIS